MIKKRWLFYIFVIYLAVGFSFAAGILSALKAPDVDISLVNRIVKQTEEKWETGDFSSLDFLPYQYTVINNDGTVRYQSRPGIPSTVFGAVREHEICLDVTAGHSVVGKVLIFTGYQETLKAKRITLAALALLILLLLPLPFLLHTFLLNKRIMKPFREMKDFARHIAAGNLDFPLPMDKSHVFGAFTESFDLMREQLKEARKKKAEANRSKKELTASLSHDIKTPVASIKLTSELMLVTESDSGRRQKLQTIYQKSEQIDSLITNMLQASLEELGELKVQPAEETSQKLEELILEADYESRIEPFRIPGCILYMDTFRMEQVIGNIINNAYKYAKTAISVESGLTAEELRLELKDYGKGVPKEELPYVFNKFYRGNQSDKTAGGSGLGLYIVRSLMEKMGGSVECHNRDDGFSVVLYIPLYHPGL